MNDKDDKDRKDHGTRARSREFAAYEQVDKRQDYHLAEQEGAEAFDEEFRVRTCDLGRALHGNAEDRRQFAEDFGTALEEIGFAILENTGIAPELYVRAAEQVQQLFEGTPLPDKLRFAAQRHGSVNQGYFPIKETSDIHPDLVEGWVFCRRAFALDAGSTATVPEFWPDPAVEPFFRELCGQHERLIKPLVGSVMTYLKQEPGLFDDRLTGANFGLRLNYYPPVDAADADSGAGRLLGHEDVTLLTLLPAPQVEGLQVLNRSNFKWVRLSAPPGSLIVNTGDYMQRITNDVLPSTTHRVSKPRDAALLPQPRVSFPLNVYLPEDELLEVLPGLGAPKYEPIRALTFHTGITSKYYGDDHKVDD